MQAINLHAEKIFWTKQHFMISGYVLYDVHHEMDVWWFKVSILPEKGMWHIQTEQDQWPVNLSTVQDENRRVYPLHITKNTYLGIN